MVSSVIISPPGAGSATINQVPYPQEATTFSYCLIPTAVARRGYRFVYWEINGYSEFYNRSTETWGGRTDWQNGVAGNPPAAADYGSFNEYEQDSTRRLPRRQFLTSITAVFQFNGNHQILRSSTTNIILRGKNGQVLRYD